MSFQMKMRDGEKGLSFAVVFVFCAGIFCQLAKSNPRPQADATMRSWNQPVEPFRIIENIYYVGASDITSFLIVTPAGDILLDGGFVETAPQIEANIKKLGFRLGDVKILLSSHAHYDHAGGLAELKRATGATFYARAGDTPVLESGGHGDPSFVNAVTFPPVKPDRLLHDGSGVMLGGMALTAHVTAGHTKGCTTWSTTVNDGGKPYHVVFVCSTSVLPGIKLLDNRNYPTIARDYEKTFRVLHSLPCDIFLASHGSFFELTRKHKELLRGRKPNPFIDPEGYRAYVERSEAVFRAELRRQQASAKSAAR